MNTALLIGFKRLSLLLFVCGVICQVFPPLPLAVAAQQQTFAASHAIDRPSFKWFFSSSFRPQKRKEKPLRKTSLTHAETTVTNRLFVLFDRSIVFLFPSLFKLSILLTCCFLTFVFVVLFFFLVQFGSVLCNWVAVGYGHRLLSPSAGVNPLGSRLFWADWSSPWPLSLLHLRSKFTKFSSGKIDPSPSLLTGAVSFVGYWFLL